MRLLTTTFLLVLALMSTAALAQTENCLFFSEYLEGSSNNKALEIYNATDTAVNLANVQVLLYSNGAATPSATLTLNAGTLANGDTYVIANPSSSAAILAVADQTSGTVANFNGDDAVELKYNGVTVDVIGQIGMDPGAAWGAEPNTTVNHTLTRDPGVCCGDPVGNDAFNPAFGWLTNAVDTVSLLGSHTTECQAVAVEDRNWGSLKSQYR